MTAPRVDPTDAMREHIAVVEAAVAEIAPAIERFGDLIVAALGGGGTVLTFGNGGSAADAQHLAGELIGRYTVNRRPLRAVTLSVDPSVVTCIANDFGYEDLFGRQVEALAGPGDLVVGITTSGKSPNVIRGLDVGRRRGATTVALTGSEPGPAGDVADHVVAVPSRRTARIQEVHTLIVHLVSDAVEDWLAAEPPDATEPIASREERVP